MCFYLSWNLEDFFVSQMAWIKSSFPCVCSIGIVTWLHMWFCFDFYHPAKEWYACYKLCNIFYSNQTQSFFSKDWWPKGSLNLIATQEGWNVVSHYKTIRNHLSLYTIKYCNKFEAHKTGKTREVFFISFFLGSRAQVERSWWNAHTITARVWKIQIRLSRNSRKWFLIYILALFLN